MSPGPALLSCNCVYCSFGEVYRGIWRQTDVAVKRLLDQEVSRQVGGRVGFRCGRGVGWGRCAGRRACASYFSCQSAQQDSSPLPPLSARLPASPSSSPSCLICPHSVLSHRLSHLLPAWLAGWLQMLEEFRQEISIMKRLHHPHIVQFVSVSPARLPQPPRGPSPSLPPSSGHALHSHASSLVALASAQLRLAQQQQQQRMCGRRRRPCRCLLSPLTGLPTRPSASPTCSWAPSPSRHTFAS